MPRSEFEVRELLLLQKGQKVEQVVREFGKEEAVHLD